MIQNIKSLFSRKLPFHKSLFFTISSLFFIFVVAIFVFQYNREKAFRQQILNSVLQDYNDLVNKELRSLPVGEFKIDSFVRSVTDKDLRITVIGLDGKVQYDSKKENGQVLDSHRHRPEIEQAFAKGSGYALRRSSTMSQDYFYSSQKYDNYIIRSALPFNHSTVAMLKVDKQFIYFLFCTFGIVILTLLYFCNKLGISISILKDFSNNAEREKPIDTQLKPEPNDIGSITENIICIYQNLLRTKEELSIEKEKLIKHLQFSKEGLAVFSDRKNQIIANNLFIQYVNLIADKQLVSIDDVFQLEEFDKINAFIDKNIRLKQHKEEYHTHSFFLSKNGKSFQLECIIFQDNTFEISINNITQQEEESRLKRQLTQNIAHELKTPVSSIQGYMETIIANPGMAPDKMKQFLERCYAQTIRLSGLLHDISLLNRIDESNDLFDLDTVNLSQIINDIAVESATHLREKDMTLQVNIAQNMPLAGNYSLLYSIFRNLTDNAMAYAGEGTKVTISCYHQDATYYYFSFSDSGVGVSEEHLNRLFERFYRVDKGRSRKLGGTGLGLAIVKNAVLFHRGEISAKNRAEGGLEFLFTLRKS